ncbi:MAG TPA: type II toxin-antitoxin system VapC family toxin [Terriglobia bacterium]
MKYLLDTHTFLWSAFEPRKLSKAALAAIQQPDCEVLFSMASLWEISILQSLGRIELKISIIEIAQLADSELAATLVPIEPVHLDKLRLLPFHHRDPFDRLLIAQALTLEAKIIGKDDGFDAYGIPRVW